MYKQTIPITAACLFAIAAGAASSGKWQTPEVVELPLNLKHAGVSGDAQLKLQTDGKTLWTLPPVKNHGKLRFDLKKLKINPLFYDEIRIRFKTARSIVFFASKLTDYPVKDLHRNWYSKVDIQPEKWIDARFDLRLDDDGWFKNQQKRDGQFLNLTLYKRYLRIPGEPPERKVIIASIKFIRYPVSISFDEFAAKLTRNEGKIPLLYGGKISWLYKINLRNNLTTEKEIVLSANTSRLKHFKTDWTRKELTLKPREYRTIELEISIPESAVSKLPELYSEPVEVLVKVKGSKTPAISPLLGFRPRYLWGTIPPKHAKLHLNHPKKSESKKIIAAADKALDEEWGVPLHGPGLHPQGYIDKKTNSKLDPISWFRHKSRKTGRKLDSREVYLAFVGQIHIGNFKRADLLGKAWELTGEIKYASAARDVFLEYVHWYPFLPVTGAASTSGMSRLDANSLMTCFWFKNAINAYARIQHTPALGDKDRKLIEKGFFVPEMKSMYAHNIEYSNMQVHHFETYTCAAIMLEKYWNLLGDALYGSHGFNAIVERTFTEDGLSHEGRVYHWFTLAPLMEFIRQMQSYGLNVMSPRFKRVFDGGIQNSPTGAVPDLSLARFYVDAYRRYRDPAYIPTLKRHNLWPIPGDKNPPEIPDKLLETSSVQPNNGYLWLREKSAKGFRAMSINYIMQVDRGEHDRLHYELFDPERLTSEVYRITYGSKQAKAMYDTISHNTVVMDKKNYRDLPSKLAVFLNRKKLPAALITEEAKSPLYENTKFGRVLALLDGIFFVGDVWHSPGKHSFDWAFYAPNEPWAHAESGSFKIPFKLNPTNKPGYKFIKEAKAGNPGKSGFTVSSLIARYSPKSGRIGREKPTKQLYLNFAGMPNATIFDAKAPRGHRPKPGPMLMVRQNKVSTARFGVAFDAVPRGKPNRVKSVKNIPLKSALSAAWKITTDSGSYLVVINRTGKAITVEKQKIVKELAVIKL
jgi:hypothetical protein